MPLPRSLPAALALAAAFAALPASPHAEPRVVADILPVHSIVARVMDGAGVPSLVVPPGASPHGHALRPSEAAALEDADLVVWVGPGLTPWLEGPLDALAGAAERLTLAEITALERLEIREGTAFEAHEEGHDHDHGHDHGAEAAQIDPHLWLDPQNAATIAAALADTLAAADPANAALYAANAGAFEAEMTALAAEIETLIAPARGQDYFVFHDAYQYFERRFDVPAAGSIALSDAESPRAQRVAEIRTRFTDGDIACVFAEPQFEPGLVTTLIEGTDTRTGTLDPVGTGLEPGAALYPALIRGLAENLADCLTPGS